ncbi:hypothetical protein [Cyanobium sp. ATX 6F1]|uniref:hypothetical protein n=1 Tax=unclassified Cyanobium TaxID=2627006 RepID=UPI0020CE7870|nr:hypothetical protein [Cyanobium sp. ATX 6F1]MCP9916258.1 hypothetical protein [Cyanobium sp. ATX 6F1]
MAYTQKDKPARDIIMAIHNSKSQTRLQSIWSHVIVINHAVPWIAFGRFPIEIQQRAQATHAEG